MIKLLNWEYWPFELIYTPPFLYYLYLSIKARSPFFFSAANPGIETGGMMGESKIKVLEKVPKQYLPTTMYVENGYALKEVLQNLKASGLDFPLIAKPNIGSRGFLVKKITNQEELAEYLQELKVDFLLQEYIDSPMELSVMYYRFPNQRSGTVSSLTVKKYLSVHGDGTSNILELIKKSDRAKLQLDTLIHTHAYLMDRVPANGELVELVPLGNHCRGAMFINGNHLIDDRITKVFDGISHQLDGIYFGRFDLKCTSLEALKAGHVKILEINGVGAEPAHIYDPSYSLIQAFKDIIRQWNVIYRLSVFNKHRGQSFMSFKDAYRMRMGLFTYKKLARSGS